MNFLFSMQQERRVPFSDARLPVPLAPRHDCREGDEVEVSCKFEVGILEHLLPDFVIDLELSDNSIICWM